MFLSIIIPVYNAEKYIRECLDSCLAQNISPDDYEIICVDDGSSDGSAAILRDYAQKYNNISVISKENGGVSSARNEGIARASGDYLWFIDADDFISKNILSQLKTQVMQFAPDRLQLPIYEFESELSKNDRDAYKENRVVANYPYGDTVIWSSLFRKDKINELGLKFDPSLPYGEDTLFSKSFSAYADLETVFEGAAVYFYRRNAQSVTAKYSNERTSSIARSHMEIALCFLNRYEREKAQNGYVTEQTANELMANLRKSLSEIAQLPIRMQKTHVQMLRERGLFPFHQPSECTYTCRECANEPNGMGKIRNILRYYAYRPMGLMLSSVPYSFKRTKTQLSHAVRKNQLLCNLLDAKNRLRGRH